MRSICRANKHNGRNLQVLLSNATLPGGVVIVQPVLQPNGMTSQILYVSDFVVILLRCKKFCFCKKVRGSGELSLWCCWPVSHSNTLQSLVSFNWSYICLVLRAICMRTHREGLPAQVRCWPVWESRVSLHTFIRSYICWNPLSYPWETFFCHTG